MSVELVSDVMLGAIENRFGNALQAPTEIEWLRDAGPTSPPAIRPNHLATEDDKRFFVDAVRTVREVLRTAPIDSVIAEEYLPGPGVVNDDEILDYVRNKANIIYHPCGTCRMGSDAVSVVDPVLRVRGVAGAARRRCVNHAANHVGQH